MNDLWGEPIEEKHVPLKEQLAAALSPKVSTVKPGQSQEEKNLSIITSGIPKGAGPEEWYTAIKFLEYRNQQNERYIGYLKERIVGFQTSMRELVEVIADIQGQLNELNKIAIGERLYKLEEYTGIHTPASEETEVIFHDNTN